MYDLIIVGGGPAAIAAAVYAKRKLFNTLILTNELSGAFEVSAEIKNFIGMPAVSGEGLMKMLKSHLRSYEGPGLQVMTNKKVIQIIKNGDNFDVKTESADFFSSKFVLIASGRSEKRLDVKGAAEFEGRGVFYCVECDAPLMSGKNVAVIGSGNSGLLAAKALLPYAQKIYVIEKMDKIKGEEAWQQELEESNKVSFMTNIDVLSLETKGVVIAGKKFLGELNYLNLSINQKRTLDIDGVFVKVGSTSNSLMVKDLVKLNDFGEIIVNPCSGRTSCDGVWAAGDVTDCLYRQINIAIGDAIKAVMDMGSVKIL